MSCVSLVPALPAVSQSLVDVLARKHYRGDLSSVSVPELWRRLVYRELEWCSAHVAELTYRHRLNACMLVDWHHAYYGYTHERWLVLYSSQAEMFRRQAIAELDWCSLHLDELTPHHRDKAIDLLADCLTTLGVYHSWWSALHW